MSPIAMPDNSNAFTPLFDALRTAPTAPGKLRLLVLLLLY